MCIPTVNANVARQRRTLINGAYLYVLTEAKGLWQVDRQSLGTMVGVMNLLPLPNASRLFAACVELYSSCARLVAS